MWTAAGVQESALAVVIISREDVERETLREEGVGGERGRGVAVILQAQSSGAEASCSVTAHHCAAALNILDTEQVSSLTGCLTLSECVCAAPLALIRSSSC